MVKRKETRLRKDDIIDIEEYHDGNYGAPGQARQKREKPTKEQIERVNAWNKAKRCRLKLLQYFTDADIFATLTYKVENRPEDMRQALKDFRNAMEKVRREYRKRGKALYWIRNIEKGIRGAWHIHLVINEIGETASIMQKAWAKGGIYLSQIRLNDKIYDEDFTRLASYLTKDENSRREKGSGSRPKRIREASYNTSRNMPLPEPKITKLKRWRKEPKPKRGYYIARIHEGVNPVTGYLYRRYTLIRIAPRQGSRRAKVKRRFPLRP